MSIVEPDRHSSRKFLTVHCPCGRDLRAPIAMAGQEISCWECHRMVHVPVPHSAERAYWTIRDGLEDVFELRWLCALFLGAAALVGVLCIPAIGVPLSTIVLFLGAVAYGEVIRQCGTEYWEFDDWKRPGWLAARLGVALALALCLAAPMLLAPGGFSHVPRFNTLGVFVAFAAMIALPLAMFLTYARDEHGPLGLYRGGSVLVRYPLGTILALLLVPVGVVATELVVALLTAWFGTFRFLVLELFPGSEHYAEHFGIAKYGNYTRPYWPDARFLYLYLRRLHQGYSLTTGLPASLSTKTFIIGSIWTLELTDGDYLRIRAIYSQLAVMTLSVIMAVQARWLGAISTLDSKRSIEEAL
jgi:hypothetical protein